MLVIALPDVTLRVSTYVTSLRNAIRRRESPIALLATLPRGYPIKIIFFPFRNAGGNLW